ncbi:Gibberellin 2-beta-dioxygenase 7 [Platanthera zijinensis]|uniref:Gibberellin 2-beta-dioxygenase 7 n=1 Tax=Platanthera zijinensis TaxID=2320716 RepID=A0AAP0BRV6_9ASPA
MGSLGGNSNGLPKVDLSGLGPKCGLGTEAWGAARSTVALALQNYGGFEVVYDRVGPDLRNELLGQLVPEMFSKPAVRVLSDERQLATHGVLFMRAGLPFVALQLAQPNCMNVVQEYARILWPEGNDFFSNTVKKYAGQMEELIQMIHRMILESLGLENHYDSHMKSLINSMRFLKYYKDSSDNGSSIGLSSHQDSTFISIVCQHNVEGLEVQTAVGDEWIYATPFANTFTVLAGEAFMAWTNGRIHAPIHRVKLTKPIEKRYTVVFSTTPSFVDDMINTPEELVDAQNPLLFKPFKYYDYVKVKKDFGSLKAYCGA